MSTTLIIIIALVWMALGFNMFIYTQNKIGRWDDVMGNEHPFFLLGSSAVMGLITVGLCIWVLYKWRKANGSTLRRKE